MTTTVTVTCDRCGGQVAQENRGDVGRVSADLGERYESVERHEWELCRSCFADILEVLHDCAGTPSTTYSRADEPEKEPEAAEAVRRAATMLRHAAILLATQPDAVLTGTIPEVAG